MTTTAAAAEDTESSALFLIPDNGAFCAEIENPRIRVCNFYSDFAASLDLLRETFAAKVNNAIDKLKELEKGSYVRHREMDEEELKEAWSCERAKFQFTCEVDFSVIYNHANISKFNYSLDGELKDKTDTSLGFRSTRKIKARRRLLGANRAYHTIRKLTNERDPVTTCELFLNDWSSKYNVTELTTDLFEGPPTAVVLSNSYPWFVKNTLEDMYGEDRKLALFLKSHNKSGRVVIAGLYESEGGRYNQDFSVSCF